MVQVWPAAAPPRRMFLMSSTNGDPASASTHRSQNTSSEASSADCFCTVAWMSACARDRFACRHSCCDELPRDVLQGSAGRLVIGRDVYAEHAAGAYGYNLPAL